MTTNTVSPATASLLAAAGFPQPAPAPGQWWGDESGVVLIFAEMIMAPDIYWEDENGDKQQIVGYTPVVHHIADGRPIVDDYFDARDFRGFVYLPTVGDILRELPNDTELMQTHDKLGWIIIIRLNGKKMDVTLKKDGSEHEAAALAYLELKKN